MLYDYYCIYIAQVSNIYVSLFGLIWLAPGAFLLPTAAHSLLLTPMPNTLCTFGAAVVLLGK